MRAPKTPSDVSVEALLDDMFPTPSIVLVVVCATCMSLQYCSSDLGTNQSTVPSVLSRKRGTAIILERFKKTKSERSVSHLGRVLL